MRGPRRSSENSRGDALPFSPCGRRWIAGAKLILVGYETLAITAALPTWTWLAAGGTALLAAGVAMERKDVGPLETGKRLVDVVDEKFA